MRERFVERGDIEFDKKQTADVRDIGKEALRISRRDYCSGFPNFSGGRIQKLAYNNALHNEMVGDDAEKVGSELGFSSSERTLLRVTGRIHDLRQNGIIRGVRGIDERESAEWAERRLLERGNLPAPIAKLAGKAILGTEPLFDARGPIHGKVIGQKAQNFEYDSKFEEQFVKSVASADLGVLYTPMGPYLSHMLYLQRQGLEPGDIPNLADLASFQQNQVGFLQGYRYPLKEAGVLATHKKQVIRYVEFLNKRIQAGDIPTWDELIGRDLAFMKNPNAKLV